MSSAVQKAEEAISKVFSDTSVSPGQTRSRLEHLRDHINDLLASLPDETEEE